MIANLLNHWVQIERWESVSDGRHGWTNQWTPLRQTWAGIFQRTDVGRWAEQVFGPEIFSELSAVMMVRPNVDVKLNDQVRYKQYTYKVRAVTDPMKRERFRYVGLAAPAPVGGEA